MKPKDDRSMDERDLDDVIARGDESKYEPGYVPGTAILKCGCGTRSVENGYPITPRILFCSLHAAAPDLLAALEHAAGWQATWREGVGCAPPPWMAEARAAIAKATGGK